MCFPFLLIYPVYELMLLVYTSSDPIADGATWTAAADFASQVSWQKAVGSAMGSTNIFSAGVYFGTGSFDIAGLAPDEGSSLTYVKDFCSHNYPQSASTADLETLMSHSAIATQIKPYAAEYSAAAAQGKVYIMGETNSGTCQISQCSSPLDGISC